MAATKMLADSVFDAAGAVVMTCNKAQVVKSSSAVLINSITLDSGNFSGSNDYSSGSSAGRNTTCLSSAASDMKAISVSSAGAAKKIRLLVSSAVTVVAVLSSAVSLGASDQVNLGTFSVIFIDPT